MDYGRERLQYRLPYLNPHCIYRVRAVLYHASSDTWEQSFAFDRIPAGRFTYRPQEAETVPVTIPRDLYRKDFSVDLDIARISGDYASVAELKVYEYYALREKDEGGRGTEATTSGPVPAPPLTISGPMPLRDEARISYVVSVAQPVSIGIYDIGGRCVHVLAAGRHEPGEYAVVWHGTDARGRKAPAGAYFVKYCAGQVGATRKVLYAR